MTERSSVASLSNRTTDGTLGNYPVNVAKRDKRMPTHNNPAKPDAEVKITDEMVESGADALFDSGSFDPSGSLELREVAELVYRAMELRRRGVIGSPYGRNRVR